MELEFLAHIVDLLRLSPEWVADRKTDKVKADDGDSAAEQAAVPAVQSAEELG